MCLGDEVDKYSCYGRRASVINEAVLSPDFNDQRRLSIINQGSISPGRIDERRASINHAKVSPGSLPPSSFNS
jgi:hypothetical protein